MSKHSTPITLFVLISAALVLTGCAPLPAVTPEPPSQTTPDPRAAECVPAESGRETAELVEVIDGDTIEIRIGGQVERVRYIGIDTPERDDPYYQEARTANQILLGEGELLLAKDVSDRDRYGRLLRYVFSGEGYFVNYELMRGGYAQIITFPPDVSCADTLLAAQEEARDSGAGIWSLPHFVEQPGSSVVIETVAYDGIEQPVETDEYAVITNTGEEAVDLTGWTLNAGGNQQDFVFPGYVLDAGQSCRVYTNEIHPETCGFSFQMGESIWANSGDCGYLYDSTDALMDEYCYSD
ncbi:MAG: lamin tail domain-containing protein [Anaerolineales bacterium]|jgi:endonuclease YncB( thermonuclease family)